MAIDFSGLVEQFAFQGRFLNATPFGTGHIHDTFLVRLAGGGGVEHRYILQRINQSVFPDPIELMENIGKITDHLRRKILASGGDPDRRALSLIRTKSDKQYIRNHEGEFWRSYRVIEGARTYDEPRSNAQVQSAGRAYGTFLRDLDDFPSEVLHLTIPDFHHTGKRYRTFSAAVANDTAGRANQVRQEIDFVEKRADLTGRLVDALELGDLPVRSTHNDTKLNNVMIDDATGEGVCVVDLDTVMPGTALYDYGDAIRTIAMSAAEDEPDLSAVGLRLDYFEDFTRGYLESARPILTSEEIDQFPFSAILMNS